MKSAQIFENSLINCDFFVINFTIRVKGEVTFYWVNQEKSQLIMPEG